MGQSALENLLRIGQLKAEPCNPVEAQRMLAMARTRLLDAAHQKRNLAEYEGYLEVEESAITELYTVTSRLISDVEKLIKTVPDPIQDA
jgi:hypothetical protein